VQFIQELLLSKETLALNLKPLLFLPGNGLPGAVLGKLDMQLGEKLLARLLSENLNCLHGEYNTLCDK
jgi:hypothetical protein